jgi:hypothetical protein
VREEEIVEGGGCGIGDVRLWGGRVGGGVVVSVRGKDEEGWCSGRDGWWDGGGEE